MHEDDFADILFTSQPQIYAAFLFCIPTSALEQFVFPLGIVCESCLFIKLAKRTFNSAEKKFNEKLKRFLLVIDYHGHICGKKLQICHELECLELHALQMVIKSFIAIFITPPYWLDDPLNQCHS